MILCQISALNSGTYTPGVISIILLRTTVLHCLPWKFLYFSSSWPKTKPEKNKERTAYSIQTLCLLLRTDLVEPCSLTRSPGSRPSAVFTVSRSVKNQIWFLLNIPPSVMKPKTKWKGQQCNSIVVGGGDRSYPLCSVNAEGRKKLK